MHASTQLPVRMSLLLVVGILVLAEELGFESIFGAFAAGMIIGLATRGESGKPLRDKIDAVLFGWFFPFFFVGTGIKFDRAGADTGPRPRSWFRRSWSCSCWFAARRWFCIATHLAPRNGCPLCWPRVPSLSIVVVITEIGLRAKLMNSDIAAAMVGAALLSLIIFPTVAGFLLPGQRRRGSVGSMIGARAAGRSGDGSVQNVGLRWNASSWRPALDRGHDDPCEIGPVIARVRFMEPSVAFLAALAAFCFWWGVSFHRPAL